MGIPGSDKGVAPAGLATGRQRWLVGIIRGLAAVAAVCLLPACALVKIAYNQAPDLAYWQLDSYLDMTGEQSLQAKASLRRFHGWHRDTQLPGYVALLQQLQQQLPSDTTPARVCTVAADVREKFVAMARQAEPALAELGRQLDPPQLKHMAKKFDKTNADDASERTGSSAKKRQDKRFEQALERAERLYGPLGAPQRAVLARRLDQSPVDEALQLAEKQRRQRDLLAVLQPVAAGKASPESALVAMRGWVERSLRSPDAAYQAYSLRLTQESCQTIAELHNSTTPAQRGKAMQTLQNYIGDFQALQAAPG